MPATRPRRLLRSSRACNFCHKRRIKCERVPSDASRCKNCDDFDVACIFDRPIRRGNPSEAHRHSLDDDDTVTGTVETYRHDQRPSIGTDHQSIDVDLVNGVQTRTHVEPLSTAWQAVAWSTIQGITRLLQVYHETVYPIFPFFDCDRLAKRVEMAEHVHRRPLFASVMAACALASARARDGALAIKPRARSDGDLPSEMFFAAAHEALPQSLLECQSVDYLRAYALLALASLQDAKIAAMNMYLGSYFTLISINQWHDEARWPTDLQPTEVEDFRALFWSIYTLDIYSSIVWDGCIHFQESHARVNYPTTLGNGSRISGNDDDWITGWNFTTDLYRIMEHDLSRLRSKSSRYNLNSGDDLLVNTVPANTSYDKVNRMYSQLSPVFQQIRPATGNSDHDIFGFQAANIQATIALLQMISLEDDADMDRKCNIVSDVLSTFHRVPTPYLRAISTPLIYHIGGIGTILGSVLDQPLSESSWRRVRDLLLSMAELLESLEAVLRCGTGAGQKLRDLAARVENYVQERSSGRTQPTRRVDSDALNSAAMFSGDNTGAWDDASLSDFSTQFQLPGELFEDWSWPFATFDPYANVV
ncbi:hypothetical protein K461DRAFT_286230 [Myriangium duriaei CBS 260.36]|uniref:Zn(2)-C6 fungal-type domain-containing protein n=1 Tax=Myriangium duriaei CBS 260.36 TaxID=1168546 RepID=A0A9P4J5J4_9PEZI|nr:hypothetical protein K461DRAFT_286230 [Myriangium duriaei CBS 260.36]